MGTGLVAVAALIWALLPAKDALRTAPVVTTAPSDAMPAGAGVTTVPEPDAATPDAKEAFGTVTGTLRYEDGAPAVGRSLTIDGEQDVEVDAAGDFHFDNVRPGYRTLFLVPRLELRDLWLEPGEERGIDLVIARGATVRGRVVAADERVPVFCAIDVVTREGRILHRGETKKHGLFDLGWVPGAGYVVAHGHCAQWSRRKPDVSKGGSDPEPDEEEHEGELENWGRDRELAKPPLQSAVVACDTDRPDVALEIALPRSRGIEIRFENLPPEWTGRGSAIPYMIWWRDRRGIDLTLPPSNAIGNPFPGFGSISLDERDTVHLSAPPPGVYTMSLLDPNGFLPAWVEPEVTIPEGAPPDQTIRLPDGARVIVSHGGPEGLAIGPASAFPPRPPDPGHVFPRVPKGHHAIWRVGRFSRVRVGEIDVPSGGEIRHEIGPSGTAGVRAKLEAAGGDDPAELRRESDNEVVASECWSRHWFAFSGLEAGRYTLIVKGRRIPVVLVEGEKLDLGVIR